MLNLRLTITNSSSPIYNHIHPPTSNVGLDWGARKRISKEAMQAKFIKYGYFELLVISMFATNIC